MSTTSRTEVYGVRLFPEELAELHAEAEAKGIKLSDAMREGAKLYLSTRGQLASAATELEEAVAKAQSVLRSAREENQ